MVTIPCFTSQPKGLSMYWLSVWRLLRSRWYRTDFSSILLRLTGYGCCWCQHLGFWMRLHFFSQDWLCNFGVLLDSQLLLKGQMSAVARGGFAQVPLCTTSPLPQSEGPSACHSCSGYLTIGLLQSTLHGDYPEAPAGSECSSASSNRCLLVCLCVTIATQGSLTASWLPGAIQIAGYYLWSHLWNRAKVSESLLISNYFCPPSTVCSSREGTLQVFSSKHCHLVQPRKCTLSVVASPRNKENILTPGLLKRFKNLDQSQVWGWSLLLVQRSLFCFVAFSLGPL